MTSGPSWGRVGGAMGHMIKFIGCLWIFAAAFFTAHPAFGASESCRKKIRKASQGVLADFMDRSGALPHLNAEQETQFFDRLLKLEAKIVARAKKQKLVSDLDDSSRAKAINSVILPLLGKLQNEKSLADETELEADLNLWNNLRDEFLRRNLGLIAQVASRIYFPSIPFDYQLSEYLISLNRAFYGFEPKFSFKFSTYAYQALKRNVFRSFQQWRPNAFASGEALRLASILRNLNRQKQFTEGRHLSREEVAAQLKISLGRAREIMLLEARPKNIELDAELSSGEGKGVRMSDYVEIKEANPNRDIEQSARLARLAEASWQHINDESIQRILRAFSQGLEFKVTGKDLGLDRRQVSYLLIQGLLATRAILGILSDRITDEKEIMVLKKYFGIFGEEKKTNYQISQELKISAQSVRLMIESSLEKIDEEFLHVLLERE